jgi:hypothetical protein
MKYWNSLNETLYLAGILGGIGDGSHFSTLAMAIVFASMQSAASEERKDKSFHLPTTAATG